MFSNGNDTKSLQETCSRDFELNEKRCHFKQTLSVVGICENHQRQPVYTEEL